MASLKIASYNLNNLFERAAVMELEGFSAKGKEVLKDLARLNELLENESYAGIVGTEISALLEKYFLAQTGEKWFTINEVREKLFSRKRDGSGLTLKARGRDAWVGWVELTRQKTNGKSVENTGRVISAVNADIMCTVEVDSRTALLHFNDTILKQAATPYRHVMVIDGNDERGIDVGVLSQYPIESITSHVDDVAVSATGRQQKIFSRDCPEYTINIGNGQYIYLLCNHLKSKGYGAPAESNRKRKLQADRVTELLSAYDMANDFVVVAGDFNDTPDSAPLANLINYPGLHDVLSWTGFNGPRWTYHSSNDQIDYLMVSTALFNKITAADIERRGIHKRGNATFQEVDSKVTQASDHACVWATFTL